MFGYAAYDTNLVFINTNTASRPLANLCDSTNGWYGIGLRIDELPRRGHLRRQHAVLGARFRSVFALEDSEWGIWSGSNPHYHTTHDTIGNLTLGQVRRTAQLTVASVAHVAGPVIGSGIVEAPGGAAQARPKPMLLAGELALPVTGRYELFSADGRSLGRAPNRLPAGVYYLKTEEGSPPRRLVKVR